MGWSLAARSGSTAPGTVTPAVSGLPGLDVSSYQGNVNWTTVKNNGAKFAYIKATESTSYTNPYFSQQYVGSYNVGLIRGAYHFATPNTSSGAAQADYFASHGGAWSADHHTLPGALDIEYNPYGSTCYGLSQASMRSWIHAFVNEYHSRTGRWAVIYSTLDWWKTCTGNSDSTFANNDPLWIARYSSSAGTLPHGLGLLHVLAVRRQRDVPRRPGRLQRHGRPAARPGRQHRLSPATREGSPASAPLSPGTPHLPRIRPA